MGLDLDAPFDVPHLRWHHHFGEYPSHLSDIDDWRPNKIDTFERFKPTRPDPKKVVGISSILPIRDDDEKFVWYDPQGETMYTNPPDSNQILIDHGMDEEDIWSFGRDLYN